MAQSGFYPGSTLSDVARAMDADHARVTADAVAQNQFLAALNHEVTQSQGQRSQERIAAGRDAAALQQAQLQANTATHGQDIQQQLGTAEFANRLAIAKQSNDTELARLQQAKEQGVLVDNREWARLFTEQDRLTQLDDAAAEARRIQAEQFKATLEHQTNLQRMQLENQSMNPKALDALITALPQAQDADTMAAIQAGAANRELQPGFVRQAFLDTPLLPSGLKQRLFAQDPNSVLNESRFAGAPIMYSPPSTNAAGAVVPGGFIPMVNRSKSLMAVLARPQRVVPPGTPAPQEPLGPPVPPDFYQQYLNYRARQGN